MKSVITTLSLCLTLTTAAIAEEAAQQEAQIKPQPGSSTYQQILAERLPQDTVWLNQGNDPVLGLHRASAKSSPKGNILLLTSPGSRVASSPQFKTMRVSFADQGWNTLVVPVPAIPVRSAAPRLGDNDEADGESNPENDNQDFEKQIASWSDTAIARINEAITFLGKSSNGSLAVVAEGQSAELALQLAGKAPIRALTLIDRSPIKANDPDASPARLELPVLEISTRHGAFAKTGRNYPATYEFSNYTRVTLQSTTRPLLHGENALSKRIRGWLSRLEV
jgi:hypothetical protein